MPGDSPDWPPPGWTEDVKVTNGRKIKYYTNVETGKKFYSKKEVTRYMNKKDTCHDVTQAMDNQDKSCSENNASQMNDQDESCSKNNVSQMNNQDTSCSDNNVNQTAGGPNNSHEWLPPGWTVELKTRKSGSHAGTTYKVYIDPSTGNKFYSKPEVSKYLKTMKQNNIAGEGEMHANGESSNGKTSEDSKNVRGRGQSRISKRQQPDTGQATHGIEEGSVSKKASQDSEEVGEQSCISKRKKSGIKRPSTKTSLSHGAGEEFPLNEKTSLGSKKKGSQSPLSKRSKPGSDSPSAKSVSSVAVDCDSVDKLPPRWKKEFIIQENDRTTRKDLLYTDPVNGYKFRSKKEVFHHLQAGDASGGARRPAKRNAASTTRDDSPVTDDAKVKKEGSFMTGRQLFAADEGKGEKGFGTCSPAQQAESLVKQPDCSVSDPNTIISSILAEINENHSLENAIEDAEIETVSVCVKQPSAVSNEPDLLPQKQLLEHEPEKPSYKAVTQQLRKSRNTESLNHGRRVSKRLAGQNPEAAEAGLDPDEQRALPLVVEKSASLSLSMNVCGQELLQDSNPTPETCNSDQASLNGEASVEGLPPGWKKEIKITKKAHGLRKDPLYIDPVHGYEFRSKKDVFRYLQTGDINSCAIKPVKRDQDATMNESSPTAANTNSKKLGCSATEKQSFAAKESRGRKRSVTCSPEVQADCSKKQAESSVSNANTITTSPAADINAKDSNENVIEKAEKGQSFAAKESRGRKRSVTCSPEVQAENSKEQAKNSVSNANTIITSPAADINAKHSNENVIEKAEIRQSFAAKETRGRKRSVTCSPEVQSESSKKQAESIVSNANTIITSPEADINAKHSTENVIEKAEIKQSFAAKESRGRKRSVTCSPEVQPESSKKQAESRVSNANTIISPAADINAKHSNEDVIEKAEVSLDTKPEIRDSSAGTKVIAAERLSAVSTTRPDLPPEQQSPETEHKKHINKEKLEQSRRSKTTKPLTPGRRMSKRLVGHSPEPVADLDLGERAFRAVVKKSASLGTPLSVSGQELPQNRDSTVGTDNSDQASLSREASHDEFSPEWRKEILTQNRDPTLGTGNSHQASLNAEASGDKLSRGLEKEMLAQNKDPTVGAGYSDQPSLSREGSGDELLPGLEKEVVAQNKDPIVGTGKSDQDSPSREASGDKLSPGLEKVVPIQSKYPTVGTGNSDQASPSREASGDELSPGLEKEVPIQSKYRTIGTGNFDQASPSRKASGNELSPGLEKGILTQNRDPTVGSGNSDQASPSRNASGNELSPGLVTEIPTQDRDPMVGTGYADQASPSRKASGNELSPGLAKEIPTQRKDLTVGTHNSNQASLSREASLDEIPPGWEKEILGQNKYPTVGTGNSGQASLRRKLSPDEIPPGWENVIPPGWKNEIPDQKQNPIVGTRNFDQASLSREEASLDDIPPGWEKEILAYKKDPRIRTGNSDHASLSRGLASADEVPPGWEKEMLTRNKNPTVRTGNSTSLDDIPPGWEKELLIQNKDRTVGTGNSYQSFLSGEASVNDLPPGWKKELRMRKHGSGIKDPYYTHPEYEYAFRSKKDVMRYLQTGDIRSCAVRPTKRDPHSAMKDNSPSALNTSLKKLGCSLTGRQLSASEESKGRKCPVTCSLALQAKSSNEQPESTVLNLNTSISSIESDITEKHSSENVNEDAGRRLDVEPERRNSLATTPQSDFHLEQQLPEKEKEKHSNKRVPARSRKLRNSKSSTPVRRVSKRLSNAEMVADFDIGERVLRAVVNNSASTGLPLNVSGGKLAPQTNLTGDSGQPSLSRKAEDDPFEVVKSLSDDQAFKEQNLANKLTSEKQNDERILQDSQPAGISYESGKVHLEHQAVKERSTQKLVKEEQDRQDRFLSNCQPAESASGRRVFTAEDVSVSERSMLRPAGISYESGKVHLEHQAVKERSTQKLVKEEQDSQDRYLNNSQPAELASGRRVFPAEEQSVSESSSIEQVIEKRDYENKQLQASHLAEPSWRSVDLNVENQQWQYSQLAPSQRSVDLNVENQQWQYSQPASSQRSVDLNVENQQWQYSQLAPSQRSVDLNVENQQWQDSQLAPSQRSVDLNVENQQWQDSQLAPSQRSVDLNVENQQWQDSQLAPSQRSVDLNVANQQWQDSQLAEPSQRSVDLNVNHPVRERQTGELVTENQDEQHRRLLHAQLASYPFGDYWADPCMEFAFKTLTGAIPVEDNNFQGSAHQEYNTSFSQADDGCFELPLFNTSSFYMNDVPNHCAPSVEHVVKEQPPINPTFLPTGNNSIPGGSSVVSQYPGLAFLPNGNNSAPGYSSVVSQNPGLDTHAKDYQSKFKSQR